MTGTGPGLTDGERRVPTVVAHPDDQSFGLGGLLALLADGGAPAAVLCFTHGEASTLHGRPGDLHTGPDRSSVLGRMIRVRRPGGTTNGGGSGALTLVARPGRSDGRSPGYRFAAQVG
ncbi:PIG-L family deacetylase [Streptomyces sp. NPDC001795]|uniref:PIG-L family deacetylase n=1 Tax=unclassified Streptomyces TaxID=2593676 RepID=UPI00332586C9